MDFPGNIGVEREREKIRVSGPNLANPCILFGYVDENEWK
jgi:hypothetical protein